MHIEPGIVNGAKIGLSYLTSAAAVGITFKFIVEGVFRGFSSLGVAVKCMLTTLFVFSFFEVLPHYPLGVSEVHLIFGSTLFLLFGVGATAFGLVAGLFLQGIIFAPSDLPQLYINISTLLFPLFAVHFVAKKIIRKNLAYKDLSYKQVLSLTGTYQGGTIAWVAFWCFYGQGTGIETINNVAIFGIGYSSVIAIECLLDLGILAMVKRYHNRIATNFLNSRLVA